MKVICISDTHTKHEKIALMEGDVIIHAGDISYQGLEQEVYPFLDWYASLNYKYKILIAGNHDFGFENSDRLEYEQYCKDKGIIYLNDSGVEIEGYKIWGSPVTPEFCDWAFNRKREETDTSFYTYIKPHWDMIPDDTDILVTHGPPFSVLDQVQLRGSSNIGQNVGCKHLLNRIMEIKPMLHVFGHIHEGRGFF